MQQPSQLPEEVAAAVDGLLRSMDPQGEPVWTSRRALHRAIELHSAPLHPRAAYFRRAKWGIGCAFSVLPIWAGTGQDAARCSALLRQACAALRGQQPLDELERSNEALFVELLDAGHQDPALQVPSMAAFAAYAAVRWVVYGFEPATLDLPPEQLDPVEWEPALYASIARAGGTAWHGTGDAERRRRCWTWCTRELLARVWDPRVSAETAADLGMAAAGTGS